METDTDSPAANDWQLADLARAGDEEAYAELIARHQDAIHAFVYRHIGDAESARDVTQEVFIRAWFALDRVRAKARFTTWLFQIAINLCRDFAKSKSNRQSRITDPLVRLDGERNDRERELPDPSARPDQQTQTSEAMAALEAEIAQLPVDLRESFLLGAVEGHPQKEIAAMLGVSPKTVEVRIYRARQRLIKRLAVPGVLRETI